MSRTETDSLGTIEVPDDAYWGAQTQRSLEATREIRRIDDGLRRRGLDDKRRELGRWGR